MKRDLEWPEGMPPDFAPVEAAIFAAGHFVHPSDDLRPRTLEAAKERCTVRRIRRKFGAATIAAAVVLWLGVAVAEQIAERQSRSIAPSLEIQHRAIEYATRAGVGLDWGLTEVFGQLRQTQSVQLGRSPSTAPQ